jgi:alpha-glucoside transport system substrate-binding protein
MGQIWLNDDYVYGGTANIPEVGIFDSPLPIVDNPPGCYLHKQASFGVYFFPDEAKFGVDYDFFYLPPIDPEFGRPVLVSGVLFAMVNDRPEVREVMRYLTTAESTETLIKNGGFLSPHRETPIEWFQTPADLRFAQIALSADTYRFDGSDLMPDEVGLGSFYRGITDWVKGADLTKVLREIDESWPE